MSVDVITTTLAQDFWVGNTLSDAEGGSTLGDDGADAENASAAASPAAGRERRFEAGLADQDGDDASA